MNSLEWDKLAESRKAVKSSDDKDCGNLVAVYGDKIVVIEGYIVKSHEFIVPNSKVDHFDEKDVYLNISRDDMISNFDF
jgi:hypothetical protein